ncbi:hypothetical protein ZB36_03875 [Salmonella enterica subsp. enterica]|nr:hypothetical protein [Salmonella enterica subsp. enterica serovar Sandiego]
MQNLESIECSTSVKFYVGAHFSARFLTVSAITNVFTQPGHEADIIILNIKDDNLMYSVCYTFTLCYSVKQMLYGDIS